MPKPREIVEGRYELLEPLDHGAYGEVWLANDNQDGHPVAVKFLAGQYLKDPQVRARFVAEARILKQIRDENVVTLRDHGEWHGQPFHVFELIEGRSLERWISDTKAASGCRFYSAPDEVRDLFSQACRGAAKGHALGIFHRDLKPSNIMLAEVPDRARPRVVLIDYGIARWERLTATTVGPTQPRTPDYASPEQARTITAPIGPQTDVFSLAVVLVELLSGQARVSVNGGLRSWSDAVADTPPGQLVRSLADLRPDVPRPLWREISRALLQDPAQRPSDAGEFGQAVSHAWGANPWPMTVEVAGTANFHQISQAMRSARNGDTITVGHGEYRETVADGRGRQGEYTLLVRASLTGSARLGAAATVACLALGAAVFGARSWQGEEPSAERLLFESVRAEVARRDGSALAYLRAAEKVAVEGENDDARREAREALDRLTARGGAPLVIQTGGTGTESFAATRDGKLLLAPDRRGYVVHWDLETGRERCRTRCGSDDEVVEALSRAADSDVFVSASTRGSVCRWEPPSCTPEAVRVDGVEFSDVVEATNGWWVLRSKQSTLYAWRGTGKPELISGTTGGLRLAPGFAPTTHGQAIVAGLIDGRVLRWTVPDLKQRDDLGRLRGPIWAVASDLRGDHVVAVSNNGDVLFTSPDSDEPPKRAHLDEALWSTDVSDDGAVSAVGGKGAISIFRTSNAATSSVPMRVAAETVWSIAFEPDGHRLAAGTGDGTVLVVDADTGAVLRRLRGEPRNARYVTWLNDRDKLRVAALFDGGAIHIWDLAEGAFAYELPIVCRLPGPIAVSADGARALVPCDEDGAYLFDPRQGRVVAQLQAYAKQKMTAVAITKAFAATGDATGRIDLWSATDGAPSPGPLAESHGTIIRELTFSADGFDLVSGGDDDTLRIWAVPKLEAPQRVRLGRALGSAFVTHSPVYGVGSWLVARNNGQDRILTWRTDALKAGDLRSRSLTSTVAGGFDSTTFDPRRPRVAVGSRKGQVWIWDLEHDDREPTVLPTNGTRLTAAFSRDGRFLVASGGSPGIWVWETQGDGFRLRHEALGRADGAVVDLAFSIDGLLVASTLERGLRVWDPVTGALRTTFDAGGPPIGFVRVLPSNVVFGVNPHFARAWSLRDSWSSEGRVARTNLRVCRDDFGVVAEVPFPTLDTVWASPAACDRSRGH